MLSLDLTHPERSQEFISHLRSGERETLLSELTKYQNSEEGDLTASSTGEFIKLAAQLLIASPTNSNLC